MSRPQIRIYTGNNEFVDREMNDQEYEQYLKDIADAQAREQAIQEKANARNAILERLGLTEEEAKLLLS